jgi:DNA-binding NarL/FixJ family response regulator
MMKITVMLADDHVLVRECLRTIIQLDCDMRVVGEVGDGWEAIQMARKLLPDVILLDIVMPQLDGLEAARQILEEMPQAKILFLSSHAEPECVQRATELGAAGYLVKQSAAHDVINAIREVNSGNAYFSPCISRQLVEHCQQIFANGRRGTSIGEPLTPRETEVLQSIADSKGNKQIALELGISPKTVEKHRQQVMNKLGIHDVAGLTRYAVARAALLSPESQLHSVLTETV